MEGKREILRQSPTHESSSYYEAASYATHVQRGRRALTNDSPGPGASTSPRRRPSTMAFTSPSTATSLLERFGIAHLTRSPGATGSTPSALAGSPHSKSRMPASPRSGAEAPEPPGGPNSPSSKQQAAPYVRLMHNPLFAEPASSHPAAQPCRSPAGTPTTAAAAVTTGHAAWRSGGVKGPYAAPPPAASAPAVSPRAAAAVGSYATRAAAARARAMSRVTATAVAATSGVTAGVTGSSSAGEADVEGQPPSASPVTSPSGSPSSLVENADVDAEGGDVSCRNGGDYAAGDEGGTAASPFPTARAPMTISAPAAAGGVVATGIPAGVVRPRGAVNPVVTGIKPAVVTKIPTASAAGAAAVSPRAGAPRSPSSPTSRSPLRQQQQPHQQSHHPQQQPGGSPAGGANRTLSYTDWVEARQRQQQQQQPLNQRPPWRKPNDKKPPSAAPVPAPASTAPTAQAPASTTNTAAAATPIPAPMPRRRQQSQYIRLDSGSGGGGGAPRSGELFPHTPPAHKPATARASAGSGSALGGGGGGGPAAGSGSYGIGGMRGSLRSGSGHSETGGCMGNGILVTRLGGPLRESSSSTFGAGGAGSGSNLGSSADRSSGETLGIGPMPSLPSITTLATEGLYAAVVGPRPEARSRLGNPTATAVATGFCDDDGFDVEDDGGDRRGDCGGVEGRQGGEGFTPSAAAGAAAAPAALNGGGCFLWPSTGTAAAASASSGDYFEMYGFGRRGGAFSALQQGEEGGEERKKYTAKHEELDAEEGGEDEEFEEADRFSVLYDDLVRQDSLTRRASFASNNSSMPPQSARATATGVIPDNNPTVRRRSMGSRPTKPPATLMRSASARSPATAAATATAAFCHAGLEHEASQYQQQRAGNCADRGVAAAGTATAGGVARGVAVRVCEHCRTVGGAGAGMAATTVSQQGRGVASPPRLLRTASPRVMGRGYGRSARMATMAASEDGLDSDEQEQLAVAAAADAGAVHATPSSPPLHSRDASARGEDNVGCLVDGVCVLCHESIPAEARASIRAAKSFSPGCTHGSEMSPVPAAAAAAAAAALLAADSSHAVDYDEGAGDQQPNATASRRPRLKALRSFRLPLASDWLPDEGTSPLASVAADSASISAVVVAGTTAGSTSTAGALAELQTGLSAAATGAASILAAAVGEREQQQEQQPEWHGRADNHKRSRFNCSVQSPSLLPSQSWRQQQQPHEQQQSLNRQATLPLTQSNATTPPPRPSPPAVHSSQTGASMHPMLLQTPSTPAAATTPPSSSSSPCTEQSPPVAWGSADVTPIQGAPPPSLSAAASPISPPSPCPAPSSARLHSRRHPVTRQSRSAPPTAGAGAGAAVPSTATSSASPLGPFGASNRDSLQPPTTNAAATAAAVGAAAHARRGSPSLASAAGAASGSLRASVLLGLAGGALHAAEGAAATPPGAAAGGGVAITPSGETPAGMRGSLGSVSSFSALSGPQSGVLYRYPSHGYLESITAEAGGRWDAAAAATLYDTYLYDSEQAQLQGLASVEEYAELYEDPSYSLSSVSYTAAALAASSADGSVPADDSYDAALPSEATAAPAVAPATTRERIASLASSSWQRMSATPTRNASSVRAPGSPRPPPSHTTLHSPYAHLAGGPGPLHAASRFQSAVQKLSHPDQVHSARDPRVAAASPPPPPPSHRSLSVPSASYTRPPSVAAAAATAVAVVDNPGKRPHPLSTHMQYGAPVPYHLPYSSISEEAEEMPYPSVSVAAAAATAAAAPLLSPASSPTDSARSPGLSPFTDRQWLHAVQSYMPYSARSYDARMATAVEERSALAGAADVNPLVPASRHHPAAAAPQLPPQPSVFEWSHAAASTAAGLTEPAGSWMVPQPPTAPCPQLPRTVEADDIDAMLQPLSAAVAAAYRASEGTSHSVLPTARPPPPSPAAAAPLQAQPQPPGPAAWQQNQEPFLPPPPSFSLLSPPSSGGAPSASHLPHHQHPTHAQGRLPTNLHDQAQQHPHHRQRVTSQYRLAAPYPPPSLEAIQRLLEADLPTPAIAAAVAVLAGSLPQTWLQQPMPVSPQTAAGHTPASAAPDDGPSQAVARQQSGEQLPTTHGSSSGGGSDSGSGREDVDVPYKAAATAGAIGNDGDSALQQPAAGATGAAAVQEQAARLAPAAASGVEAHSPPPSSLSHNDAAGGDTAASAAATLATASTSAAATLRQSITPAPTLPPASAAVTAARSLATSTAAPASSPDDACGSVCDARAAGPVGSAAGPAAHAARRSTHGRGSPGLCRSQAALLALAGEFGMPPKPLQEEEAGQVQEGLAWMERLEPLGGGSCLDGRGEGEVFGVQVVQTPRSGWSQRSEGPLGRAVRLIAQSLLVVLAGAAGATAAASTLNAVWARPEDLPGDENSSSIFYPRYPKNYRPKRSALTTR